MAVQNSDPRQLESESPTEGIWGGPPSEEDKERMRARGVLVEYEYLIAAGKGLSTSTFIARHGVESGFVLPFLQEDPKAFSEITAYDEIIRSKGDGAATPRKSAMNRVACMLFAAAQEPDIASCHDVEALCSLLGLCIGSSQNTESSALEAFADAFSAAWQSITNRERAVRQHASKKKTLAEAWEHFKKSKYRSLAEGARACAEHYRQPGAPTERAFLDHFRERAKAEGLTFKPGRKSAPKPKEKPA